MRNRGCRSRSNGIESLPSDKPRGRLLDIAENAAAIQHYTAALTQEQFEANRMTRDAVERCLERISEAPAKLGPLAAELAPEQPWNDIRALGNRLRHEYDRIDAARIWGILRDDLPGLRAACEQAAAKLSR